MQKYPKPKLILIKLMELILSVTVNMFYKSLLIKNYYKKFKNVNVALMLKKIWLFVFNKEKKEIQAE
mgnify:CR=1 FL=1